VFCGWLKPPSCISFHIVYWWVYLQSRLSRLATSWSMCSLLGLCILYLLKSWLMFVAALLHIIFDHALINVLDTPAWFVHLNLSVGSIMFIRVTLKLRMHTSMRLRLLLTILFLWTILFLHRTSFTTLLLVLEGIIRHWWLLSLISRVISLLMILDLAYYSMDNILKCSMRLKSFLWLIRPLLSHKVPRPIALPTPPTILVEVGIIAKTIVTERWPW